MGIGVLILIVVGCTGCIQQKEYGEMHRTEDYFRGDFSVKGEPALNQEVTVIFSVNPIEDSFDTELLIHLPDGIELIKGNTEWRGDLKKDEVFTMKIIVKPIQEGQLEIWSEVIGELSGAERNWAYFVFFLTSKGEGQISRTPFYHEPHPVETMGVEIPVGLHLETTPKPTVGEEVVLTFSLLASEDTPNVKAEIVLPEEFIYISGTLEWTGDLKKDQKEIFQVTIKTTARGRFEILGIVYYNGTENRFAKYIFVW
jgi:hypothetical protein